MSSLATLTKAENGALVSGRGEDGQLGVHRAPNCQGSWAGSQGQGGTQSGVGPGLRAGLYCRAPRGIGRGSDGAHTTGHQEVFT